MPAGRRVVRVPLDFDAPVGQLWKGYVRPKEIQLPLCSFCSYGPGMGTHGHSPDCHAMIGNFWPHNFPEGEKHRAWNSHIGQADIDHLVWHGYFKRVVRVEASQEHPNGWYYEEFTPTVEEVRLANRLGRPASSFHSPLDLNSGAALLLAEFRCEKLGLPVVCSNCGGKGHTATPAQEKAHDEWVATDPPEGDGWQLWQTVSEGGPVSPVCSSAESLARWMTTPANDWGVSKRETISYEEALAFVLDDRPLVMYPINPE